jgi:hypothetical protein
MLEYFQFGSNFGDRNFLEYSKYNVNTTGMSRYLLRSIIYSWAEENFDN